MSDALYLEQRQRNIKLHAEEQAQSLVDAFAPAPPAGADGPDVPATPAAAAGTPTDADGDGAEATLDLSVDEGGEVEFDVSLPAESAQMTNLAKEFGIEPGMLASILSSQDTGEEFPVTRTKSQIGGLVEAAKKNIEGFRPDGALKEGPKASLRQTMGRFGSGPLGDVSPLDLVPGVGEAMALDDLNSMYERERVGIYVSPVEKIGMWVGLGLGVVGLGAIGKKILNKVAERAPDSADALLKAAPEIKTPLADKWLEKVEVKPEQSEQMKKEYDDFIAYAGPEVAQYFPDPNRVVNLRLDRLETTDDVRAAVASMAGVIDIPKTKINWDETTSAAGVLADQVGVPLDKLKKIYERMGRVDADVHYTAMAVATSSAHLKKALTTFNPKGGAEEQAAFLGMVQAHVDILRYAQGILGAPGRALNSAKIFAKMGGKDANRLEEIINEFGGAERIEKLAQALTMAPDARVANEIAQRGITSKFWDGVTELWLNGLLSSTRTMTVNLTGNALFTAWQIPETFMAGTIGSLRAIGGNADVDRVYMGEAIAQLYGSLESIGDAFRAGKRGFMTGQPTNPEDFMKYEVPRVRAISSDQLGIGGAPGALIDIFGAVVRTPTRVLLAQDEAFKTMGRRMSVNQMAYRKAMQEGTTLREKANLLQQYRANPTDDMTKGANDFAHYITFQQDLGSMGRAMQKFSNTKLTNLEIPILKFMFPFVRTPINIFKAGMVERNPVFAPLSREFRAEIKAGGARRDVALAKVASGAGTISYAAYLSSQGLITGAGPSDPRERRAWLRAGHIPYSMKVGDKWVQYSRVEPVAFLIGATADIIEGYRALGKRDVSHQKDLSDLAALVVAATASNITNKTFMTGAADFFNVMEDPNRYGGQWISRFAGTLIPNAVADIAKIQDPYLREIETVGQTIRSRIPGMGDNLPPVRDLWGEPRSRNKGWLFGIEHALLPFTANRETKDPVEREILRLGVDGVKDPETGVLNVFRDALIDGPGEDILGEPLTPWERDRYLQIAAKEFRGDYGGRLLDKRAALTLLVQSPAYKNLPHDIKGEQARAEFIKAINNFHNEGAKEVFGKEQEYGNTALWGRIQNRKQFEIDIKQKMKQFEGLF